MSYLRAEEYSLSDKSIQRIIRNIKVTVVKNVNIHGT